MWGIASTGCTPSILAAGEGHAAIVKLLITAGADLEIEADSRYTALHASGCDGQPRTMSLLINAGSDIEAVSELGRSTLHMTCEIGNVEASKFYLRRAPTRVALRQRVKLPHTWQPSTDTLKY